MPRPFATALLLLAVWLPALARAAEEPRDLAWCYRTLADVVCYTGPDSGRENRFVGTYPFRPDPARRLLLERSDRRAAALAPKRWSPVPRPRADGPAASPTTGPEPPATTPAETASTRTPSATPETSKAGGEKPRVVPVMRPATEKIAATDPRAPAPTTGPAPRANVACPSGTKAGPRPLLGNGEAGCRTEAD